MRNQADTGGGGVEKGEVRNQADTGGGGVEKGEVRTRGRGC